MSITKGLGAFNGVIIGTVLGLAVYLGAEGDSNLPAAIEAMSEIGAVTIGAATSGSVLSVVKIYPTAPVWAGALSGVVGGIVGTFHSYRCSSTYTSYWRSDRCCGSRCVPQAFTWPINDAPNAN